MLSTSRQPTSGAFPMAMALMKPHRIKMAHSLIQAYGLLPKLDVLVCVGCCSIIGTRERLKDVCSDRARQRQKK